VHHMHCEVPMFMEFCTLVYRVFQKSCSSDLIPPECAHCMRNAHLRPGLTVINVIIIVSNLIIHLGTFNYGPAGSKRSFFKYYLYRGFHYHLQMVCACKSLKHHCYAHFSRVMMDRNFPQLHCKHTQLWFMGCDHKSGY
jgi:hypothetical protein